MTKRTFGQVEQELEVVFRSLLGSLDDHRTDISNATLAAGSAVDRVSGVLLLARHSSSNLPSRTALVVWPRGAVHSQINGRGLRVTYACRDFP